MLHITIIRTSPSATHCPQAMAVTCTLPLATCHHCSRVSPSVAWCPQAIPVTHTSPLLAHHRRPHGAPEQCPSPAHRHCLRVTVRVAVGCMVPPSDACHPRVAVDCMSPSLACHRQPHGAPEQCPSPAHRHCLRVTVRVAVGCMVPPSDAHHPRIAVDRASPSLARHRRPHGAPEQCPSPAHRHCLRVTVCVAVSRMVPTSNACHPHVAVAYASPFASLSAARCPQATPVTRTSPSLWMCRRHTQLEDAQSTIPKYDVIFMVFEEGNKRRMFLYVPSTVLVS